MAESTMNIIKIQDTVGDNHKIGAETATKLQSSLSTSGTENLYAVGTDGKSIVYFNNGIPVKSTVNLGDNSTPLYLKDGVLTTATATDTKNTAGSTDTSDKIFLVGAKTQEDNPQTYSHDTAYVGTDGCLYSGGQKVLTAHQTLGNGQLDIQVNGTSKGTFTANQATGTNTIVNITAEDFGLSSVMNFIDVSTTDPKGSSGATVSGHTTWSKGDVVLYGNKEYVLTENTNIAANWTELGDEGSYTMKTITITGTGALGGGGDLSQNRTITHNSAPTGLTPSAIKVAVDSYGHVQAGTTITPSDIDAATSDHTHTTSIATSTGTSQISLAHGGKYSLNSGGTSYIFTMPSVPTIGSGIFTIKSKQGSVVDNVADFSANQTINNDITFVGGSNITLTPDATNKTITIAATRGIDITAPTNDATYPILLGNTNAAESDVTSIKKSVGLVVNLQKRSVAEGTNTTASGYYSHAEGSGTTASGYASHAEGSNTTASVDSSHAEGNNTTAFGLQSHAEGTNTTTSGYSSHAEGIQTYAKGSGSHAEGVSMRYFGNVQDGPLYVRELTAAERDNIYGLTGKWYTYLEMNDIIPDGGFNIDLYDDDQFFSRVSTITESVYIDSVGGDVFNTSFPINVGTDYWIKSDFGDESHTVEASGPASHAEGIDTHALCVGTHAEGYNTTASGEYSHAEGYNTTASEPYSHAEGSNTLALCVGTHAEGYYTTASGTNSHAEGYGSSSQLSNISSRTATTITFSAFQIGIKIGRIIKDENNAYAKITNINSSTKTVTVDSNLSTTGNLYLVSGIAYGESSHSEGNSTTASGRRSHAEGDGTTASGPTSHAEGYNTTASGNYSHAGGSHTIANQSSMTAIGAYNENGVTNERFSIGNGNSTSDRRTVFKVVGNDSGSSTSTCTVTVQGKVNASQGFFQTSDERQKNIIGELDLDKTYELIDKCQTIIYTLKDDENNKQEIGLIAQEVQKFFPELITEDERGILSLDYSRLTVIILRVLKDVIDRVKKLENK